MTPNHYSSISPFPIDLNEDHSQQEHLFSLKSQSSSSSSSLSCSPTFYNPPQKQEQGGYFHGNFEHLQNQEEVKMDVRHGGSCPKDSSLQISIWNKQEDLNENQSESSSMKWMPPKMRLVRKMMNSNHPNSSNKPTQKFEDQRHVTSPQEASNSCYNNTNTTIRVCTDCNTTKTPLWRSGPLGPKSLCNACGIRQRKARRAMAAAAAVAATNGTVATAEAPPAKNKVQHKNKRSTNGCAREFKKKCKNTSQSQGRKKLCFEDLRIILSKNTAFQRVFPQDEKEAAILLMALSYGLVHG